MHILTSEALLEMTVNLAFSFKFDGTFANLSLDEILGMGFSRASL